MELNEPVLKLRFPQKKNREGIVPDHFVMLWNDLFYYSNHLEEKGCMKRARSYILAFLRSLEACASAPELKFAQLTESAGIYLNCCQIDRGFSSEMLGTVKLSECRLNEKIAALVYRISVLLMEKTNLRSEAALLSDALLAAFEQNFPNLKQFYREIEEKSALSGSR